MIQDKDRAWQQLTELWRRPDVEVLDTAGQRYAIISDVHLGDGGDADDFTTNQKAMLNALGYYRANDYSLILLGDVEELWQFDLDRIVSAYKDTVYARLRDFSPERVRRVFGNHDREWGGMVDPIRPQASIVPQAAEAYKLRDFNGEPRLLLIHGHQGSLSANRYAWLSRFFVRLYAGVEPVMKASGIFRTGSATKSSVPKDFERTFYSWARQNGVLVICGHTHRAIFASQPYSQRLRERISMLEAEIMGRSLNREARASNLLEIERLESAWQDEKEKGRVIDPIDRSEPPLPCYFNSGCCLYSDGITTIEIEEDVIRLVKWSNFILGEQTREIYSEGRVSDFVQRLNHA